MVAFEYLKQKYNNIKSYIDIHYYIYSLPKNINTLNISHGKLKNLKTLPDLSNLTELEVLDCSYNYLKTIPLTHLPKSLKEFNCSENELVSIPNNMSYLSSLQKFNCSFNQLSYINGYFPDSLQYLDCSFNEIISFERCIPNSLQYLDCSYNNLERIPCGINCNIINPNLKYVNYGFNKLHYIPSYYLFNMDYVFSNIETLDIFYPELYKLYKNHQNDKQNEQETLKNIKLYMENRNKEILEYVWRKFGCNFNY